MLLKQSFNTFYYWAKGRIDTTNFKQLQFILACSTLDDTDHFKGRGEWNKVAFQAGHQQLL